jgi:methylated-DNA-[protein]-cysteine S-methyltransferase
MASPGPDWVPDPGPFAETIRQFGLYFAGSLRAFTLELAPGGTPFQRMVWDALRGIPYGETVTYGELARRIGRPHAVRAVGAANGANPLPIVIPCHRVVGQGGRLVGYGGGLPAKAALLGLEHDVLSGQARLPGVPLETAGRDARS